ncbi:unnamed protein product [Amoebophrya sp. A120]|nr:unnamed protein product [Amoebophrya sp. A120]|eukprot:GSA120T00014417001.1
MSAAQGRRSAVRAVLQINGYADTTSRVRDGRAQRRAAVSWIHRTTVVRGRGRRKDVSLNFSAPRQPSAFFRFLQQINRWKTKAKLYVCTLYINEESTSSDIAFSFPKNIYTWRQCYIPMGNSHFFTLCLYSHCFTCIS